MLHQVVERLFLGDESLNRLRWRSGPGARAWALAIWSLLRARIIDLLLVWLRVPHFSHQVLFHNLCCLPLLYSRGYFRPSWLTCTFSRNLLLFLEILKRFILLLEALRRVNLLDEVWQARHMLTSTVVHALHLYLFLYNLLTSPKNLSMVRAKLHRWLWWQILFLHQDLSMRSVLLSWQ